MLKTKIWLGGIIFASVLVFAGYWYYENRSRPVSILDARTAGQPMACTYKDSEDRNRTFKVNLHNEKFRLTATKDGKASHTAFDGVVYYVWTDGDTNGKKMTRACVTGKNMEDPERSFGSAQKASCQAAGAPDLTIPFEVTFADQCDMTMESVEMQQRLESEKRFSPGNLPVPPR